MKLAVIGGGSTYTPELLDGLISDGAGLGLERVSLMDIDPDRLSAVGTFCQRMAAAAGGRFPITLTGQLSEALDGADFVLTQIRVGGQEGRHRDIQLGLRHDLVGQETTGVGGFAKALRTVPVMLALCREMERACPQAWLINFTNPSGLVTEAILKHGWPRAIGLCNIPLTLRLEIAAALGVEPDRISLDYLGLNHLSWVRRVWVDGVDVLPQALRTLTGAGRPANIPEELDYPVPFLRALGMVPNAYLRYYYLTRRAVAELKAAPRDRAQEVMQIEAELLDIYRDPAQHRKPEALKRRGGAHYSTAAIALLKAIAADTGESQVVNARNGSAMTALGPDAVIEATCRVDRRGACPLPLENPPPEIRGLMQHVKAYEELAVEAAARRSRRSALLALVTHPLVGDAELADTLLDEICAAHRLHLEEP